MAEDDPHRQRYQGSDRHGLDRQVDMLAQSGRNTVDPLPVGGIGQPLKRCLEEAHEGLAQGTASRWIPASRTSARRAMTMQSTVPTTRGEEKVSIRPLRMRLPR